EYSTRMVTSPASSCSGLHRRSLTATSSPALSTTTARNVSITSSSLHRRQSRGLVPPSSARRLKLPLHASQLAFETVLPQREGQVAAGLLQDPAGHVGRPPQPASHAVRVGKCDHQAGDGVHV